MVRIAISLGSFSSTVLAFASDITPRFLTLFLVVTFMTKSALYPFSPWLPLAMAAPTPISALVHSSTLVTAGLYLIMRFYYLVFSWVFLCQLLLIVCVFTSFYAGINAVFEVDLKKLIALSTLSHLGFIGMAFFSGMFSLAFFHMLTHALFKSLLFMRIGDVITNLSHSQDLRYLSTGRGYVPRSCSTMFVSLLNLLGLPSLSGFFSKDLILESLNFSNSASLVVVVVFLNILFTYFYTYQLFSFSFQSNKVSPYLLTHTFSLFHSLLLLSVGRFTLLFGKAYLSAVMGTTVFYSVPVVLKLFPGVLNLLFFISLLGFSTLFRSKSVIRTWIFSSIMLLTTVCLGSNSRAFYFLLYSLVRSSELGAASYSVNTFPYECVSFMAKGVLTVVGFSTLRSVFFVSFLLILLSALSLLT